MSMPHSSSSSQSGAPRRSGGGGGGRGYFGRRKTCPFSSPGSPKIDYKDVRLLTRFILERGKIVLAAHYGGIGQETALATQATIKRALLALLPYANERAGCLNALAERRKTMIEVILLERIESVLRHPGPGRESPARLCAQFPAAAKEALRATKANPLSWRKNANSLKPKTPPCARSPKRRRQCDITDNAKLVVIRQASETGQLLRFGLLARDIAEAAEEAGHTIERSRSRSARRIKTLAFPAKIRLHPEVTVTVSVNVARSPEEAAIQAEKGAALVKAQAKEAEAEAEKASVEGIGKEKERQKGQKSRRRSGRRTCCRSRR